MKTVGELKSFLKDVPDDVLLVKYRSDMETSGYRNDFYCSVTNMSKHKKDAYDRFDGTDYSYEVYEPDENGEPCLRIG